MASFARHSASWIAGYKEAEKKAEIQALAHALDHMLEDDARIDHEMWVWTQGVIVGCLLVIVAYWAGRI